MAADGRLDHADELLGVTRLGDPGIRAAAHALGHTGGTGAHDHGQTGQAGAHALQVLPATGSQHRQVDDQGIEAHADERVDGHRRGQRAEIPTEGVKTVRQDLHEAGISVNHRQTRAAVRALRRRGRDASH